MWLEEKGHKQIYMYLHTPKYEHIYVYVSYVYICTFEYI